MLWKNSGSRISFLAIWAGMLLAAQAGTVRLQAQTIPSPKSVLGYTPGADFHLTRYTESLDYFKKLAAASDKIQLEKVGQTSEGQDWYIAIISSAENLKNLDHYREIARRIALVDNLDDRTAHQLAREGKAIVHIDGGLHSTECAGFEHTIRLAYDLVTGDNDPRIRNIRDNVILVLWFSLNPDGQNMVADWYRSNLGTPYEVSGLPWLYQKYIGHDNNRDGYMNNMIESKVVTQAEVREWFPMVYYNHHQTAPFPTRIWIPPFAEPVSSNVHPLMWRWTNVFGTAMASYLDEHGMPGSVHRGRFDDWYPGFIDGVNNYRNTISFLTETALYRYATPHFYTVRDFPKSYQDLRQEVFYSSPWKGGWWRLDDAVRYMEGASMAVLDTTAKYKEDIIYNRYQAGRDVIARFKKEPPYAYVIPQQQRDPQTAALLVQKLQTDGIDISQATQAFEANGRAYPAGSWVIMMDQPFALLAKELMDVQHYPDLRETPGGEPDLPYDIAGWTLPYQMGVEVNAVAEPLPDGFAARLHPVEKAALPAVTVGSGSAYVIDHRSNASFRAVNRILKEGGNVSFSKKEIEVDGTKFNAGAVIATGISKEKMQAIAGDLSLEVKAAKAVSDPQVSVKAPRIGLYSSWTGNIDEGWTRWLLEQFDFPYRDVRNGEVQAGHLRDRFDVMIIAEMRTSAIMDGNPVGSMPAEYVGGIGETGLQNLRQFVEEGGTLVTLGNSSQFAIEKFNLPVKNTLEGLKNLEFFCSGSILRTQIHAKDHPVLYGLPQEPAVFFARNAAFETTRGFKGSILLTYPKEDNPLMSGYLLHPEKIEGKAAAVDVSYGRGHVILTGFRPQWRGQTHGMFKILFNSLYYFGGVAAAAPAAPAGGETALGTWAELTRSIHGDLEKALEQNRKGKAFDSLVEQFQSSRIEALDRLKDQRGSKEAAEKLDEYKSQLKAALADMKGKDYGSLHFGLEDLMAQFRLTELEKEIGRLLQTP